MKKILKFDKVLDNKYLVERFKEDLPHRFIRKHGSKGLQVAKRAITYQRTFIKINKKTNSIEIRTMWDDRYWMILVFGIFWFLIYNKKRKRGIILF